MLLIFIALWLLLSDIRDAIVAIVAADVAAICVAVVVVAAAAAVGFVAGECSGGGVGGI